jgi:hypothetical protein
LPDNLSSVVAHNSAFAWVGIDEIRERYAKPHGEGTQLFQKVTRPRELVQVHLVGRAARTVLRDAKWLELAFENQRELIARAVPRPFEIWHTVAEATKASFCCLPLGLLAEALLHRVCVSA